MSIKKAVIPIIVIVILLGGFLLWKGSESSPQLSPVQSTTDTNLTIISTNPASLDGATISPSQPIEVTFSKPISISDFKYKLEPDIDHDVAATGQSGSFGQTFRITFKKPLELGATFTLTINSDTKVSDKEKLDKEYNYHVQTISYKGV